MEGFFQSVYRVVRMIPPGKVMSYGQVAALAGNPRMARQVGWALRACKEADAVPWHRVVAKGGRLSLREPSGFPLQRTLLEGEGVAFDADGQVLPAFFAGPRNGR